MHELSKLNIVALQNWIHAINYFTIRLFAQFVCCMRITLIFILKNRSVISRFNELELIVYFNKILSSNLLDKGL